MQRINTKNFTASCRTNAPLFYSSIVAFVLLCAVGTPATVRDNEILYIGENAIRRERL